MKRREFIAALGGAAVAWPLAARAQQPPMPVIGFMSSASAAPWAHLIAAFRDSLKAIGFVEGQNVVIELHDGEGNGRHRDEGNQRSSGCEGNGVLNCLRDIDMRSPPIRCCGARQRAPH
jgi:hypothetical protein